MRLAREHLLEAEEEREKTIRLSRTLTRSSKTAIHAVHSSSDAEKPLAEMEVHKSELSDVSNNCVCMANGPAADAFAEYAEARIFVAMASGSEIPSWESLGVDPGAWLMGLADSIGELRRLIVRMLMSGDVSGAEGMFSVMESVADELMLFDVPDAVLPLRRKQDIARGVVERTRSDIAVAKIMKK